MKQINNLNVTYGTEKAPSVKYRDNIIIVTFKTVLEHLSSRPIAQP